MIPAVKAKENNKNERRKSFVLIFYCSDRFYILFKLENLMTRRQKDSSKDRIRKENLVA